MTLTAPGLVVGTPAYMAPEQHRGRAVDPRTDQFSFCVTLWEALYGQRPFAGASTAALAAAVMAGRISAPAAGRVPPWLRRVLTRGLSVAPEDRFPDMSALITALQDDPARRRWRRAVVVAVATIAALVWGARELVDVRAIRRCERAGADVDATWNEDARSRVRAALLATGQPFAETQVERVSSELDEYALRWSAMRAANCRAANVEGTRASTLAERADECLAEGHDALASWIDALSDADRTTVVRAVESTANLPRLDTCGDEDALVRRPTPPDDPQLRAGVAEARRELARAKGQSWAGRPREALFTAETVATHADELGWAPLGAEAYAAAASFAARAGDYERARRLSEAALDRSGGDDLRTVDILTGLVHIEGHGLRQPERALVWGRMAEAMLPRVEPEPGLATAALLQSLGNVALARRDYPAALEQYGEALSIRERMLAPEHLLLAPLLNNLGSAHMRLGNVDDASAAFERALSIRERALGPDHPEVSNTLGNLANVDLLRGYTDRGIARLERALASRERALGFDNPELAALLLSLGIAHIQAGHHQTALDVLERALEMNERVHDDLEVARVLVVIGRAHVERGAARAGKAALERALAIHASAPSSDDGDVAAILADLAWSEYELGELERAHARYLEGLEIKQRVGTSDSHSLTRLHGGLCEVEEALGRLDEALSSCRQALEIAERDVPGDPLTAGVHATLGLVHVSRGEHELARVRLETARALVELTLGPDDPAMVTRWQELGWAANAATRHEHARRLFERALDLAERTFGSDHLQTVEARLGLAEALMGLDRAGEALPHAERALAIRHAAAGSPKQLAEAELVLAEVLVAGAESSAGRRAIAAACNVEAADTVRRLRRCPVRARSRVTHRPRRRWSVDR